MKKYKLKIYNQNINVPNNYARGVKVLIYFSHFRVAFYCGQPKSHLCNDHAV